MWFKILIYLTAFYLIQRLIRNLLFPAPPKERVEGRKRRQRVIDPGSADIEDARFKDID